MKNDLDEHGDVAMVRPYKKSFASAYARTEGEATSAFRRRRTGVLVEDDI